ncbi:helicase-related protein [Neochlamydia sp. AcF65]|uniref:preprotein translocase subunit SecA n=1 Tax=Neochlamydia sp. AcF65 TaxID=2795735 RepID=UPI001BC9C6EC|nr:helicase-related protein [Neochlamydia sp. AcF65]
MSSSINSFAVNNYLTKSQKNQFFSLEEELQTALENLLNSNKETLITKAQTVLSIMKRCVKQEVQNFEFFFHTLLNADEAISVNKTLERVFDFSKQGHAAAFFLFATPKKRQGHSAKVLCEIVELFSEMLNVVSPTFSLSSLPPYDYGGESYVKGLLNHSKEGKKGNIFQYAPTLPELLHHDYASFSKMRSQAIQYLTSLGEDHRLSMKIYLHIFNKIQNDFLFLLKDYEKIALLKLILMTTTSPNDPLAQQYSEEDLEEIVDAAKAIHQTGGEEILLLFIAAPSLRESPPSLEDIFQIFYWIQLLPNDLAIQTLLEEFSNNTINLPQLLEAFEKLAVETPLDPMRAERPPQELRRRFLEKNRIVAFPLDSDILEKILTQYQHIQKYCFAWHQLKLSQLIAKAIQIREMAKKAPLEEDKILELVAIGRLAIRIKFGIYPYNTQILALLGMMTDQKGRIAQIKTGEGKSTIIALLAFVCVMQAKPVDIISSSQYLAKRDCRKYTKFFKAFGIKSSHLCTKNPEPERFRAHIYYATATDLEFSVMREKLYFANLFEERMKATDLEAISGCVIVDELDNLTIDTLMNGARLAEEAEISYDWIYGPILSFVEQKEQRALMQILAVVLSSNPSEDLDINQFIAFINREIKKSHSVDNLRKFLEEQMNGRFKDAVALLSDEQLERWLKYAFKALYYLKENKQYVVEEKKLESNRTRREVKIIDADNTGRKMEGSRWSNGLHEFVEAIHHIPIQRESLNPISMSHAVLYQRYPTMYGLTGTLGSLIEREEIKEIYGVDSFDVPPHLPSKRKDEEPRILLNDDAYLKAILQSIKAKIASHQPVLVLCETIADSQIIADYLTQHQLHFQLLNEVQEELEDDIIARAGHAGTITIATNTAGRGTDIKLDDISLINGGLHVLLTFFPESQRVEDQAIGRAGRQGEPGSSEIILSAKQIYPCKEISELREKRKINEVEMKEIHTKRAEIERYCAQQFINPFFRNLNTFHHLINNTSFLRVLASRIKDVRLIRKVEIDFLALHKKDREIAIEAFRLFNMKETQDAENETPFVNLLKQLATRIENKAIVEWSIKFYQPLEGILCSDENLSIEKLKETILRLFEDSKVEWEKYLEPSGKGLPILLKDISQIDLTYYFKNPAEEYKKKKKKRNRDKKKATIQAII